MEEGKLREERRWMSRGLQECRAGTRAGVCQLVPRAGPATQGWGHGEVGGPGILKPPSPRGFRAHPLLYPTHSTALSSSNPTPHSWGLSGELLCPQSAQALPRVWMGKGKAHSPIFWVALEVSSLV